jgi:tetratricopeptide (TPR) repeat protein
VTFVHEPSAEFRVSPGSSATKPTLWPRSALDDVQARLVEQLADAWRRGEPLAVEDLLARHPELRDHTEVCVRLVYEELCLRQESGEQVASQEILDRFPEWQAELEVLLQCHGLLDVLPAAPAFPVVGEVLGDFQLLAELGRGALGRVFLASQPALADRQVVLKVTPCDSHEHLSLARLQHTHIVPLYAVHDFADRNLRALCMPFVGGAALGGILDVLKKVPPAQRTGRQLRDALDQAQTAAQPTVPSEAPARTYLARASYVEAVCWIGACMADALSYAHARGLLHLDLKPSNVLLASDGQPMLLDFHLAREPVQSGTVAPEWLGGTAGYMSPEQEAAMAAVGEARPVVTAVDARSDVYSLGLLLCETLGATGANTPPCSSRQLRRYNPHVTVGLADILCKCLACDPNNRYADAASVAADLRCHLAHLPLRGVANRSVAECWRKWRRRQPHALGLTVLVLAILLTVAAAGAVLWAQVRQDLGQAETALADGQQYLKNEEYGKAVETLGRGLTVASNTPGGTDLARELESHLRRAKRGRAAEELHAVADRLRFLFDPDSLSPASLRALEAQGRSLWQARGFINDNSGAALGAEGEQRIRTDFLDLAILWVDLKVRLATGPDIALARQEALAVLAEGEALCGPNLVLHRERQAYAEALGMTDLAQSASRWAKDGVPQTTWEHYALSRFHLRTGNYALAAKGLERAIDLQPQSFWPHFSFGICAYRLKRYHEAVTAFTVCVTLAAHSAPCYYNRALAQAAVGRTDSALQDYDRALRHDPTFAAAALNRGILHYGEKRYDPALADLRRALELGADPGTVQYNLALVYLAQQERKAALACLQKALQHRPHHQQAKELHDRLQRQQ